VGVTQKATVRGGARDGVTVETKKPPKVEQSLETSQLRSLQV
jgi:hypothetical protein